MEILKIINVYSRSGDEESKIIKREINDYWRTRTEKGEAKQFEEAFYLLESESKTSGRIIICKDQASWNPAFKNILKALKKHKADELHYYFNNN